MFVRVFGDTFLNPDAVGKFEMKVSFDNNVRTTVTRVFDLTGQHTLLEAETRVTTGPNMSESQLSAVRRDNEAHKEIRLALCERRDANTPTEI